MTIVIMIILGIETSCDETAAAVVEGRGQGVEVLSNAVSSQIEIHKKYGGVVPEVAAREHVLNILPVVDEALERAGIIPLTLPQRVRDRLFIKGEKQTPLSPPFIRGVKRLDAIAVTVGPGLVTSLLVGVETAKALAFAWRLPVVAVNHIEGHIYANWLRPISEIFNFQFSIFKQTRNSNPPAGLAIQAGGQTSDKIKFPAVILTVSGGHTMLVLMKGHGRYKVLGETRDDAAGEAFDKAAQLLGLDYPGGPALAAEAAKLKQNTIPLAPFIKGGISLPRPMMNSGDYDFSFSGLKTALFYQLQRDPRRREKISEYASEFQQAIVEVLIHKTIKAARAFKCRTVMLSGGVAANLELRSQLAAAVEKDLTGVNFFVPALAYCTDNAAMVAAAGYFRARRKSFTAWQKLKTQPNQELK